MEKKQKCQESVRQFLEICIDAKEGLDFLYVLITYRMRHVHVPRPGNPSATSRRRSPSVVRNRRSSPRIPHRPIPQMRQTRLPLRKGTGAWAVPSTDPKGEGQDAMQIHPRRCGSRVQEYKRLRELVQQLVSACDARLDRSRGDEVKKKPSRPSSRQKRRPR